MSVEDSDVVVELKRIVAWYEQTTDVLIRGIETAARLLAEHGDGDGIDVIQAVMREHGVRELAESNPARFPATAA